MIGQLSFVQIQNVPPSKLRGTLHSAARCVENSANYFKTGAPKILLGDAILGRKMMTNYVVSTAFLLFCTHIDALRSLSKSRIY
jgi:hypothetical protein